MLEKMRFTKSQLSVIPVCLFLFASVLCVSQVFAASTWVVDDSGGADFRISLERTVANNYINEKRR